MPNFDEQFNNGDIGNVMEAYRKKIMSSLRVADICKVLQVVAYDAFNDDFGSGIVINNNLDIDSSGWIPRTSREGLEFGGSANAYYWDSATNPNADFDLCLPNCTTYAYGRQLENGGKPPVSRITNASNWHNVITNGWEAIAYNRSSIGVGDILEWTEGNHVAVVESVSGGIYTSSSSYTGDDGTVESDRAPNTYWSAGGRTSSFKINTTKDISKWMISAVPNRFFGYRSLDQEISWNHGIEPTYILKNPGLFGNNNKYICQSLTTGSTIECRSVSSTQILAGNIVCVIFVDSDYRSNLDKAMKNEKIIIEERNPDNLHKESFGIIVGRI